LILAPQPSWLWVLVDFYLQTLHRPELFIVHLLISYTLLFMIFSSLLVCLVRDPGPPNAVFRSEGAAVEGEEMGLSEALMPDDDFSYPHRWCRKCWVCGGHPLCTYFLNHFLQAPKPERTHHCSICGRCVLKMGTWKCSMCCYLADCICRPSLSMDWCTMYRKNLIF
jgi:hypothetical protein